MVEEFMYRGVIFDKRRKCDIYQCTVFIALTFAVCVEHLQLVTLIFPTSSRQ